MSGGNIQLETQECKEKKSKGREGGREREREGRREGGREGKARFLTIKHTWGDTA